MKRILKEKYLNSSSVNLYDLTIDKEYAVKLDGLQDGEKISIMSDAMFRTMMQNENRKEYPAKLLSYFLDISYEDILKNMKFYKNELNKNNNKDKNQRCDLVVELDNTYINVEVNCNSSLKTMERNMEYANRLYSSKSTSDKKDYEYTPTIQLNLNNFAFKGHDTTYDIFMLKNDEGQILTTKLIFLSIYIPNIRKKWYTNGIQKLSKEERGILSLVERSIKDSKELGKDDLVMEKYIEDASIASHEENLLEAYDKEWAIKDEGIREGISQGATEATSYNVPIDVDTIRRR